jgi:hypothetical protein
MLCRRRSTGAPARCLRHLVKNKESSEDASRLIVAKRVALNSGARLSCNPLTVVTGKLCVSPRIFREYDRCRDSE